MVWLCHTLWLGWFHFVVNVYVREYPTLQVHTIVPENEAGPRSECMFVPERLLSGEFQIAEFFGDTICFLAQAVICVQIQVFDSLLS